MRGCVYVRPHIEHGRRVAPSKRSEHSAGPTAAYQRALALHQRVIVARNTAMLSPNHFGVYPSPPTPQCAGAAFIEGGNPQAPQSPGGFALTMPGKRSAGTALVAIAPSGRIHATSGAATAVEEKNCPISLAGRARLNR